MAGPVYGIGSSYQVTGAIRKHRVVERTATEGFVSEANAAGDKPVGVCQDEITTQQATDGRIACVWAAPGSIARCIAGAALTYGADVRSDAEGRVTTMAGATANQWRVGVCETAAGAAGEHVDVRLTLDQIDT